MILKIVCILTILFLLLFIICALKVAKASDERVLK